MNNASFHSLVIRMTDLLRAFSDLSSIQCYAAKGGRMTVLWSSSQIRMGLGVSKGMLGPPGQGPLPSRPDRLACEGLVSHVIVPLRANCHGILPQ